MIDFTNYTSIAKPQTLEDIALETAADAQLMQSITSGKYGFPGGGMNGIILHGKFGAGKSTAAALIPDALEGTNVGMNRFSRELFRIMSSNNGVGLLNQIDSMCSFVNLSGDKYQYFILDEVDNLSSPAMHQLKSIMDSHIDRAVFIMTTNNLSKVDDAVIDRSHVFGFTRVPPSAWLPSMQRVLAAYGITCMANSVLLSAAASINGSGRKFATCVKQLIDSYYQMFPHLIPSHLLLSNSNILAINVAQPTAVLPGITPMLSSQIATPLNPTQPTP
jgi:replication-associated recombination protein RarA